MKIPSKAQLSKRNGKGETLLHKACRRDDLAQVKVLIQAGISINMEDYAGLSSDTGLFALDGFYILTYFTSICYS